MYWTFVKIYGKQLAFSPSQWFKAKNLCTNIFQRSHPRPFFIQHIQLIYSTDVKNAGQQKCISGVADPDLINTDPRFVKCAPRSEKIILKLYLRLKTR
jgi:hypothetical protein